MAARRISAIAWKTTTARSRCGCWPTIFLSARRYGSSKSSPRPSDWRSPKVSPVCMRTRTTGRGASPSSGWTASSTDWCSTATCARMTSAAIVPGTMGALTRTCTRPSVILAICLTRTITWNCSSLLRIGRTGDLRHAIAETSDPVCYGRARTGTGRQGGNHTAQLTVPAIGTVASQAALDYEPADLGCLQ